MYPRLARRNSCQEGSPCEAYTLVLAWALVGAWRSLVAHLNGVQEVAGSNPVAPTTGFVWSETITNGNV